MKILYFTDTFLPEINGVTTSVVNFSNQLEKRGHEVHIFTTEREDEQIKNIGVNIPVAYFRATSFLIKYPDFKIAYPNFFETYKAVNRIKPEIIHAHTPSPQAWTLYLIARLKRLPMVSTYHTLLPDFLDHTVIKKIDLLNTAGAITWAYTRSFYNKMDTVVSPSQALAKELNLHGIKRPIEVISNGIDPARFYPGEKKSSAVKLLHLGRMSYEKNIDVLLKAFREVLKTNPEIELTIVGGGPDLEKLKSLSRELSIDDNVIFTGPVSHEQVREMYISHDFFITSSTIETEGLVILEAMACGLPIVGVDKLAIPQIVKDGINGFIAPAGNPSEISDRIIRLAENKELRLAFSKKSIEISSEYHIGRSIEKIENLYLGLAEKMGKK